MTNQLHFYDAANPHNIPSGVYAAAYVNGYAWPEAQLKRMHRVFRVSVLREAFWAKYARCLDIENGAALPSDLPAFIRERQAHGFNDATAYVNRSNWRAAINAVNEAKLPHPLWWVSTLDGTMVVSEPGAEAWAVQYAGGVHAAYDVSVLHGRNNFVAP